MIASVYIKDGHIFFYNENRDFSTIGGIEYELGKPLLNFLCYEDDRFDEAFSEIAETFDHEFAHIGAKEPMFRAELKLIMTEMQKHEIYVYFYEQMFMEFVYAFIETPQMAIERLAEKLTGTEEKLAWTIDFEWPASTSPFIEVRYADKDKRLFRAAKDVVSLMSDDFKHKRDFMISQAELLINFREVAKNLKDGLPTTELLYLLDEFNKQQIGQYVYLEQPRYTFYGVTKPSEVAELYEIHTIDDLCRFEFIKMIENSVFIKKCKNCGHFFIPNRRQDTEYCDRLFADTNRKCSEIGAMLRYEKKVAENPVWEVYKKAYRRFNSRTRAKKMTQNEFLQWSEQAAQKRDECLAGKLVFEDYVAWLEQGRVRKPRVKKQQDTE